MSQTSDVNESRLQKLGKSNDTAERVVSFLASRERNRDFLDLRRLKTSLMRDGERIIEEEYMEFFEQLEAEGVGSIIRSRLGRPSKFVLNYSIKDVFKLMHDGSTSGKLKRLGPSTKRKLAPELDGEELDDSTIVSENNLEPLTQKVTFVLSSTRVVELRIPDEVTAQEIESIVTGLKSVVQK